MTGRCYGEEEDSTGEGESLGAGLGRKRLSRKVSFSSAPDVAGSHLTAPPGQGLAPPLDSSVMTIVVNHRLALRKGAVAEFGDLFTFIFPHFRGG